uniref:Tetratricopeptide repeat protein n=3 Tax=unclassified Prevotella TaxID=2638335 RepID=A0AB33J9D5_9BACT
MNFLKALFGGKTEDSEEEKKHQEEKDFEVLKYDGVRAMKMGNLSHAIRCFQHALDRQEDLEIRDYLSQAFMMGGELLQAYEQLQKMAEKAPENQRILIRMANVAYMMENYQAMGDACEKALLIDDTNAEVHYLYSQACKGQGDSTNAVAMLTKAIGLNAEYGDAYLLRGEIYLKEDALTEADEDAQWLLEHVAENEDVLLLKARIETKRDNADEAMAYYSKVIEVNPFCLAAYQERAVVLRQLGKIAEAEADEQQVQELAVASGEPQNADEKEAETLQQKIENKYRANNPYGF